MPEAITRLRRQVWRNGDAIRDEDDVIVEVPIACGSN